LRFGQYAPKLFERPAKRSRPTLKSYDSQKDLMLAKIGHETSESLVNPMDAERRRIPGIPMKRFWLICKMKDYKGD
jgi:hypothetical protein